jgi:hypothetical protein
MVYRHWPVEQVFPSRSISAGIIPFDVFRQPVSFRQSGKKQEKKSSQFNVL